MSLESQEATRRRHSGESLPSMYPNSFERPSTESDNYHRRHHSGPEGSMAAPSPISPTSTFGSQIPSFGSKFAAPNGTPQTYTPPESRKNSEEVKNQRQSLPSLLEVGLVPPAPSNMTLHSGAPASYPQPHTPAPPNSHFSSSHPSLPPPLSSLEQPRYYDGARSGYPSHAPSPAHFAAEGPRPPTYAPAPSYAAHPPSHVGQVAYAHPPPPSTPYHFTHGHPGPNAPHALPPYPAQPGYAPAGVAPQHPYHQETTNSAAYTPSGSPPSKVLGKRPAPGYGNAIERALQVSSMRRDLENSKMHSSNIYNLVQKLYDFNGGAAHGFEGKGLEIVLSEFHKAVREAEELREGLEGCRRLLTEMCKEQEHSSIPEKGRPHIPEYEAEEHHYTSESNSMGAPQPEMKKMRRGRAAPPGRCHSCHRAETPEWRRGPDGARTLCNACGLHYAKLTRKMSKSGLSATTMARKSPNTTMA